MALSFFLPLILSLASILGGTDVQTGKTVYLVRHAETCLEPARDPELTPFGADRAVELIRVFSEVDLDAIYSTPLLRTQATARPVSEDQGVEVTTTGLSAGFLEALAETIRSGDGERVLVSGHSNTTPRLVNLLAGTSFEDLEETEFDRLYIVHLAEDGAAEVSILRYGAPSGTKEDCSGS